MENEPKSAAEDGEVKEDDKEEDEKKKKDVKDGKFVGLVINGTSCEWLVIHPWSSFSALIPGSMMWLNNSFLVIIICECFISYVWNRYANFEVNVLIYSVLRWKAR